MNHTLATWMLAGALAASLAWNLKEGSQGCQVPPAQGSSGIPDLSRIGLSAEQTWTLQAWCDNSCASSCSTEREAEVKLDELHRALRDPSATPESLRALAAEVSRLRERSLEACVDSILEVRRVLTDSQLSKLLECCATTTSRTELRQLGYSK